MSITSRSLKFINIYKSPLKYILGKAKYFSVVYKYCYSYKYTCTFKWFQVHLFLTLLQLKTGLERQWGRQGWCMEPWGDEQHRSLHFQRDTATGPGLIAFV